jgi:hypothetical protein
MQTQINGINKVTGNEIYLQMNQASEQLTANGGSRYEDATRTGKRFSFRNTTGVAAVNAIPTIATNCSFFNSDPDGGRSMIIDAIFASQVGNWAAAVGQCTIIYVLGQTRVVQLAADALIPRKLNGLGPSSDTCALISIGGTDLDAVTGVVVGWMPACTSRNTAVNTLPGLHLFANMDGLLIVPPGRYLGIHVLSSSTTPTFSMGIQWHEKQITLK